MTDSNDTEAIMPSAASAASALGPDYSQRWGRARRLASEAGLDALYVTSGPNFSWLSGWSPYPGGYPIWLSALLLPVNHDPAMIISTMHKNIVDTAANPVKSIFTYEDGEDPGSALKAAFAATGLTRASRIGVASSMWYGDSTLLRSVFPELDLEVAARAMDGMRSVKDAYEIALLRKSGEAVDAMYRTAAEVIKAGVSMADAGLAIMKTQLEYGANHPKVGGTFRFYEQRSFKTGELVDVDTGASFGGYSTDTARNVFVGEPTSAMLEQYEVVKRAYRAAEELCRPGMPVDKIHQACASVIAEAGYEQTWKVGHGVGLADGHEAPLLQPGNQEPLEENMVFTIDPGFFIGRDLPLHIEDTVLVTASGIEPLNRFSYELVVV